jgi:hypothetical protein
MTEKEKLILNAFKEYDTLKDSEIAIRLKSKYQIFRDIKLETLRRYVSLARYEYGLPGKVKVDWDKIYEEYVKIANKFPKRPMAVIAKTLSEKYKLTFTHIRSKLYVIRRYGKC